MARSRPTVIGIASGTITLGAPTTTTMVDRYHGRNVGGNAIEAGGQIRVVTGPVDVIVRDQNGVVLFDTDGVTAGDTAVAPVPRGVKLPLEVVTENITGSVTVFWSVKK